MRERPEYGMSIRRQTWFWIWAWMGLFYLVRYLINLETNYRFTLNEFGGVGGGGLYRSKALLKHA
jgi:hypothetical protein